MGVPVSPSRAPTARAASRATAWRSTPTPCRRSGSPPTRSPGGPRGRVWNRPASARLPSGRCEARGLGDGTLVDGPVGSRPDRDRRALVPVLLDAVRSGATVSFDFTASPATRPRAPRGAAVGIARAGALVPRRPRHRRGEARLPPLPRGRHPGRPPDPRGVRRPRGRRRRAHDRGVLARARPPGRGIRVSSGRAHGCAGRARRGRPDRRRPSDPFSDDEGRWPSARRLGAGRRRLAAGFLRPPSYAGCTPWRGEVA